MRLISWNVNGLRACLGKGFLDYFKESKADIFCIQETKMQKEQAEVDTPGYFQYWNSAEKKGYSGTAVFTKEEPLDVTYGLGLPEHDTEGRVITCRFPEFFLVNVYTPNSQRGLTRLPYRMEWEDAFRDYLLRLKEQQKMTELLESGFVDSFRFLHPDAVGAYSWWSYMFNARQNNAGWRIDYFLTSEELKDRIETAEIHSQVLGSDHCPVLLELA